MMREDSSARSQQSLAKNNALANSQQLSDGKISLQKGKLPKTSALTGKSRQAMRARPRGKEKTATNHAWRERERTYWKLEKISAILPRERER